MKKTCRRCNEEKESKEFSRLKRSKDGLYSYCKKCDNKRNKLKWAITKEYDIKRYEELLEARRDRYKHKGHKKFKKECKKCSKVFYTSGKKVLCCSHSCARQLNLKTHPCYKGKVIINGYICIKSDHHPHVVNGYVGEHRLVMEKHLDRFLEKNEVVHHIDRNKQNNNISNLQVMTNSEHLKLHIKEDFIKDGNTCRFKRKRKT